MAPVFGFCFRPEPGRPDCSGPLHLWIGHHNSTRFIRTGYDIRYDEWDAVGGRIVIPPDANGRTPMLAACADGLARDMRLVGDIVRKLQRSGKPFTPADVADAYNKAIAERENITSTTIL